MKNRLRSIFWIETILASLAASLAVVTGLWPQWIERVFHIDPDHYSGSVEWQLVVALWFVAALLIALAVRDWRRAPLTS